GWGVVCLPIAARGRGDAWAAVSFGIDDDFKTPMDKGGTFGNRPLDIVLRDLDLSPRQVWHDSEPRTLWDAKLWHVGPIGASLRTATAWTRERAFKLPPRLVSMRELLTRVDQERLILHRDEIQRLGDLHHLSRRIE